MDRVVRRETRTYQKHSRSPYAPMSIESAKTTLALSSNWIQYRLETPANRNPFMPPTTDCNTQLRTHLHYLESMERIDRIVRHSKDIQPMMRDVVECMLEVLECDRAWLLYPCNPEADYWRVPVEATRPQYPGVFAEQVDMPVETDVAEAFRMALDSSGPIIYDPTTNRHIPAGDRFAIRSQMLLAIHPRLGDPWMIGVHQCSHLRTWSKDDQRLFQDIANRLTDGISNLLPALDELGLTEDTLVVFTGDHGESMTEHGIFFDHHGLYDCSIHVPFSARWPGHIPQNVRLPHTFQVSDVAQLLKQR